MPRTMPIPIPGSARSRLIAAGIAQFQLVGYERSTVTGIARDAGVTTGSLYHHFTNKLGLFTMIRDEMETRMTERMEGASAALGGAGRPAVQAGMDVAIDAAVRFGVTRILAESRPDRKADSIAVLLAGLLPRSAESAGAMLAATWRAALLAIADGTPPTEVKAGMQWVLNISPAA